MRKKGTDSPFRRGSVIWNQRLADGENVVCPLFPHPARRLLLVLVLAGALGAQQSKAIYRQVASVATSLTAGSAAEAMMPFDKSCAGYEQLQDDFSALVSAYQLVNQIEILEQNIVGADATLAVRWVLTLRDPVTELSETRTQDVTVKLSYLKYQWRIVSFSPLELFNPELQKSRK